MMHRRAFLRTLGLLAAPFTAEAQPAGKVPRVGFLFVGSRSDPSVQRSADVVVQALRELGRDDGQLRIEYRWAEGQVDRLVDLATELVNVNVEVIVALTPAATEAAVRATKTIPIVTVASDPVAVGFMASIARPTGNITGLSMMGLELGHAQAGPAGGARKPGQPKYRRAVETGRTGGPRLEAPASIVRGA